MSRPLRIAVASSGLGHVTRGVEAWAADLAAALHARGEDVTLFKGGGRREAEYERVLPCCRRESAATQRIIRWSPRGTWRVGMGSPYEVEQTTFSLALIRELRARRTDILHVQDPQVAVLTQWARRLGLVRAKVILGHGTRESPEFLRRIHYLQHLAPWHLEQSRAAGVWRPEWTAIPNFVDTNVFRPGNSDVLRRELGIPAGHFVLLSAAAIKRTHKRVDYLVSEFARFLGLRPAAGATLVVAGGYESETEDVIRAGRELLGDRVRFLVRFPRERMSELYRAADAFALGSLSEMMPIAVLEAIASGLPCLVNRHPILEWMVGPGGLGLDLSAEGELATALARLLDDPVDRRRMGQSARAHAVATFGQDQVVEQILTYYRFASCDSGQSARRAVAKVS